MDKKTQGAWIIHHGKKITGTSNGAASYPAIDIAAKSGALLARMAASKQSELNSDLVITLAKAGGLSPKTDLPACLAQLVNEKVIDQTSDGAVSVIGVSASSALDHTSALFEANDPEPFETAAIGLGELVSQSPISKKLAGEKIGDEHRLTSSAVTDFLGQSMALGFIESDEDGDDPLLFNGNLFRRESIGKTKRVLESLSATEQTAFVQFEAALKSGGALKLSEADRMLGTSLLSNSHSPSDLCIACSIASLPKPTRGNVLTEFLVLRRLAVFGRMWISAFSISMSSTLSPTISAILHPVSPKSGMISLTVLPDAKALSYPCFS